MTETACYGIFGLVFASAILGPWTLLLALGLLLSLVLLFLGTIDIIDGPLWKSLAGLFLAMTGVLGLGLLTGAFLENLIEISTPLQEQIQSWN